jgi:hypothetical protein
MLVIDVTAADHDREVEFWRSASGLPLRQVEKYPEFHGAPLFGPQFGVLTQRIDEGTSRMHVDIHTDDVDAEVARLEGLGAVQVRRVNTWCIMRDPAGLLFCVVPEPPGRLDETNSNRWD